ncbi:hypothetical protein H6P81_004358 [Aristolochia fimbriata]|uniref:Uncharacterized protein n=1 Tax=Aristolochia fimbriata TaxID=158543 RepID=A0AAV7FHG6_ARIFI|nr:hypothetical protein H6P81_004358 [Aristolochia fimbriata]
MAAEQKAQPGSNLWGAGYYSEQRILALASLAFVFFFVWYVVYEAIMVTAAEQLKRLLVVSPLLIVVVVHWLSALPSSTRYTPTTFAVPDYEPGSIHRAGGSPWGLALLLLLLFFLISYQPSFHRFAFK